MPSEKLRTFCVNIGTYHALISSYGSDKVRVLIEFYDRNDVYSKIEVLPEIERQALDLATRMNGIISDVDFESKYKEFCKERNIGHIEPPVVHIREPRMFWSRRRKHKPYKTLSAIIKSDRFF